MNRGKTAILSAAGLAIFAAVLYWGLLLFFRRENQQFASAIIEWQVNHAIDQILAVANQAPEAFVSEMQSGSALEELIRMQPAIKLAMIVYPDGRIANWRYVKGFGLDDFFAKSPNLRGFPEEEVLADIKKITPGDWRPLRFEFKSRDGKETVVYLHVVFDPQLPPEMIDVNALRSAWHLVYILLIVMAILAVLLIQQRMARRLRMQRDSAQQLAYVGTLAAGLAHEIRNPLNALAMQLEMLEEDVEASMSQRTGDRIQRIRSGLQGVGATVSEFLNYASPGRQKPAMVDLEAQLGNMCREFNAEQAAGEGQVDCVVAPGLAAWCDVNALRQILGNLLTNGWRAQAASAGGKRILMEAAREGDWVSIRVDDAGGGVPAEMRGQIFEAFFSTSSEGSGLGLPIARRLAEMNRGRLDLAEEPSPLGGARFILKFPAQPPKRPE